MGMAVVHTRAGAGLEAPRVTVEVHLANGLPAFQLVGMAETAVKEARDRVRSALINSGFEFPAKRITVNLAPASIPKQGGRYDLAIAIGILIASGVLLQDAIDNTEFIGELALTGELRAVSGLLPAVLACRRDRHCLIHSAQSSDEAGLVQGIQRVPADSLLSVHLHLSGQEPLMFAHHTGYVPQAASESNIWEGIIGQHQAKRALVIAAAGSHNLLFTGPPGTGKSLLASRLTRLLPPLSIEEALEVASLYSVKEMIPTPETLFVRPYRSPHHTSSAIALTGGGTIPLPGEISLAHRGVLFLDELPEFGRRALDVLREPLETGEVHISRANAQATFPAQFQLIAAMNPSPTGDAYDGRTTPEQILKYMSRISGPLLDRIDIQVEVPRLTEFFLHSQNEVGDDTPSSECPRSVVTRARERQLSRQKTFNAFLQTQELGDVCQLSANDFQFYRQAAETLKLSMRAFHRILKVARTIADIEDSHSVTRAHLSEALGYRALETLLRQLSSS